MIDPAYFLHHLDSRGFHFFTGVPCSYFRSVIHCLKGHPASSYYIAPNEGSALALASGAVLGGEGACVMIQNSGLGNLLNPLTSLSLIYNLPVLLFVSARAYGIADEPQHEIMGKKMGALLDALEIAHWDLPQGENFAQALDQGLAVMRKSQRPVVFFVRKGTFAASEESAQKFESRFPMKRMEAISVIRECLDGNDLVFATTGKPSRELFAMGDRPGNFYMQGSMGHIASLGLGVALLQKDRRVIVLDGDGAFLMHMGVLSMVGRYQPRNFYHLVLDNESYETTGDQDTTSTNTDFEAVAQACGYRKTWQVKESGELRKQMPKIFEEPGPVLLRIKINRLPTKDIPRITSRYEAPEITASFLREVQKPVKAHASRG